MLVSEWLKEKSPASILLENYRTVCHVDYYYTTTVTTTITTTPLLLPLPLLLLLLPLPLILLLLPLLLLPLLLLLLLPHPPLARRPHADHVRLNYGANYYI